MKAIVLAAGYGTRLYPLTLNRPKALLDVADKPIVEHLMDRLLPVPGLDHIYLAINDWFAPQFQEWLGAYRSGRHDRHSKVISSITIEEANNAGAISSLYSVLTRENVDDDVLVIAADNLFSHDFENFVLFAQQKGTPVVGVYNLHKHDEGRKYGSVVAGEDGRVVHFEEKPEQPRGNTIAVALYYYPRSALPLILQYVEDGNDLKHIGLLVEWMYKKMSFYTWRLPDVWFDIGSKKALEEANHFFTKAFKGEV